ncbi:MAG: copper amine oxidase N-terminal domain-containing protein [Defluviitaleaceae bacterium]|nr:copper amine oxidase N-terminal domain-containing protein [Defluviitaleaceae bacterium]
MGTPLNVNGITFVPVRYVSETTGATVRWDGANNAVYIYQ